MIICEPCVKPAVHEECNCTQKQTEEMANFQFWFTPAYFVQDMPLKHNLLVEPGQKLANKNALAHLATTSTLVGNKRDFHEQVKRQAFDWMSQLEGWCSDLKATTLIDLVLKVKPNIIVEIGVWGGKSLIPMACALKANKKGTIFGIDPWDSNASIEEIREEVNRNFWSYANHDVILRGLLQKIDQFDLHDQIILVKNTSEDAPIISGIDILHIDGNHSTKKSLGDVTKWVPHMNSGGWIIFDDMTWCEQGVFTTAAAVEWLDQHCTKIGQFSDIYCVWGIWVKP